MTQRRPIRFTRVAVALCAGPLLAFGSINAPAASAEQSVTPSTVNIPYLGEIEVAAASGYTFTDCPSLLAATKLITECTPSSFTASAPEFDPEIAPQRIPVAIANAAHAYSIDYVIQLEPPPTPDFPDTTLMFGLNPGDRTLVPFAALGFECELCTPGTARIEIAKRPPVSELAATLTGSHLVLTPSADFSGEVEIGLRLVDDLGQRSKVALITANVSKADSVELLSTHLTKPAPENTRAYRLSDLLFTADDRRADASVVICGGAIRGSLICHPDGTIEYTPASDDDGALEIIDQFWVLAAAPDGWQGLSSITFQDPSSTPGLAPAIGAKTHRLEIPTVQPEDPETTAGQATSLLTRVLDRIGGS